METEPTSSALNARPMGADLTIDRPTAADGGRVHELIAACPPLDGNSLYCNLLQCSHFAATCSLAMSGTRAVGWVSGYRLPDDPATLFIWQVAVREEMRGRRLAKRLIEDILGRSECAQVTCIHTSVTQSNAASRRMFEGLARSLGTTCDVRPFFDRDRHLAGRHPSEDLLVIGPFARDASAGGDLTTRL